MFPGDPFPLVLLLFLLQDQLNKQLLELLVAVIDAELLKAARKGINQAQTNLKKTTTKQYGFCIFSGLPVVVEDFKAIDVQDTDNSVLAMDGGV